MYPPVALISISPEHVEPLREREIPICNDLKMSKWYKIGLPLIRLYVSENDNYSLQRCYMHENKQNSVIR